MYGILTLLFALTLGSEVQNIGKNEPPGCDVPKRRVPFRCSSHELVRSKDLRRARLEHGGV